MVLKQLTILAALLLGSATALAHPVAFQGALGVMAYHQPDMIDWQIAYSVTSRFALGVDYYRDAMESVTKTYYIPRVNWLVHRWNGKDYQANIYVFGGYGVVSSGGSEKGALFGGGEADYETRAVYVSGKATTRIAKDLNDSTMYQLRAGIAPYAGDYEGLNTWLILQSQYFPNSAEENLRVGPVLRFFYRNVLWETGVSSRGTWNFNFMVHF